MPKTCLVSQTSLITLFALGLPALSIGCGSGGTELEDAARNISRRAPQTLEHSAMAGRGGDDEDEADDETDYNAATDGDGAAGAGADADGDGDGSDGDASGDEGDSAGADGEDAAPKAGSGGSHGEAGSMAPPTPVGTGPTSDDSVRCGNGMLDLDELCDILIPYGMEGACPKLEDCAPLDACHAAALEVRGCWTQCALGAEVPCSEP